MMKSFTLQKDEYNRVLKFSTLHVRNEGESAVKFIGQFMPPGASWSHPNNNMSVTTEERLVVQFESQNSDQNSLVINYFT